MDDPIGIYFLSTICLTKKFDFSEQRVAVGQITSGIIGERLLQAIVKTPIV